MMMSTITNKSILWQAQEIVADILNADAELSGKVTFIPENQKDIDFQLKNALGRQGIVGIVMTPKAEYRGTYQGESLVWELKDFTVQVVENPVVNRPVASSITALDAAMRAMDCLGDPLRRMFATYNPHQVEQGEDNGLIVAQAKFDSMIRTRVSPPPPFFPDRQAIKMTDGTVIPMGDGFFSPTGYDINTTLRTLGYTVNDVEEIYVFSKLESDTAYREYLKAVYIDSSCPSIGKDYWSQPFSGSSLEKVVFKGRTYAQIAQMQYYPWGLADVNKIIALDDTIIPTKVTYTEASGLPDWEYDIVGQLSADFIPNISSMQSIDIGNRVTSIGENAFAQCPGLMDVTFVDKDKATVQGMANYSWGLPYNCLIHCTDGDFTPADLSKLLLWKTDGQMVEVVAPERVTSTTIEQAVYPSQRNTIVRAHIPDNVTSIDYGAFFGCDSLTGINIGNCVTSLGSDLFWNCTALSTLTIPSSVESIGENAFYNCSALTDVTFNGKTLEQVRAMNQYPWGISDTSIIHAQS